MLFWILARLLSNLLLSLWRAVCLLKANLSTLNESLLASVLCFISLVSTYTFMRWNDHLTTLQTLLTTKEFSPGWRWIQIHGRIKIHNIVSGLQSVKCITALSLPNLNKTWKQKIAAQEDEKWVSHHPNFITIQCFCSALQKYKTQENMKKNHD